MYRRIALLLSVNLPSVAHAQLLVNARWLHSRLDSANVVVLEVGDMAYPGSARVPGAQLLATAPIAAARGGISYELRTPDELRLALKPLGISNNTHVVLYSADMQAVGRALFTMDYLGLRNVHVLQGGLLAWKLAGYSTERGEAAPRSRGKITASLAEGALASADWVQQHLGKKGVALIDTRSVAEYDGTGDRRGAPSRGHIQGAQRVDWEATLDSLNPSALKDMPALTRLYQTLGVSPRDTVVTYCLVGARASLTYLVARLLGHPTKLYDGSYDEWSKRGLPLVKQ